MTTFIMPGATLGCRSKSFYLRESFVRTDQGNHGGEVTTDLLDRTQHYTVGGCPYYHSPNIALVHYGENLPWEIKNKKMMRGASAYNHTGKVDAGVPCGKDRGGALLQVVSENCSTGRDKSKERVRG